MPKAPREAAFTRRDDSALAHAEGPNDGVLIVDAAGKIISCNQKFFELWNIPESVASSNDERALIAILVPQIKDPAAFAVRTAELYASAEDEALDVISTVDGRTFERYTRPYRLEGKVAGRVWSFHQVAGLVATEQGPLARERRFRTLFESNPVPMYVFSKETLRFLEVNEAAVARYGYRRDEFLRMTVHDIRPDQDVPEFLEWLGTKRVEGEPPRIWRHRTHDGRVLSVKIELRTIEFEGQPAALALAHDVSAFVLMNNALEESREKVRREATRASSLLQIADRLNAQLELNAVLETVCEETTRALGVPAATVMLYDESSGNLVTSATRGLPSRFVAHKPVAFGKAGRGIRAIDDRVFVVDDIEVSDVVNADLYRSMNIRTIASATMKREGSFVGAIVAFSTGRPRHFGSDELMLLKGVADHACQAVANARLATGYQKSTFDLAMAYDKTLEGWSRALDLRDHETEGHCRRVSSLADRLGHVMGESPESLTSIRRGSLLHDIGKMAIPDRILLKPGPLDEDEWAIMRRHPEHAREFLEPIPYLASTIEIPYAHHERWDGTGYPLGLRETEIPIAARIFSITDVWDALRSDRPYRKAWSAQQTRKHILRLSGVHFDPIVTEAFLELELD